ncbi:MAG: RIP metalloprotease RseP [Chromatiales bacterium]
MMSLLYAILAFIVAVGVLITVHEFGHFWVARRVGVKILRFSIGFGRPLWLRRIGPDRTEFVFAALPLGGYVKMLDEREGEVAREEAHRAFNRQVLWKRTAVVLAGPLANFFFAIIAYAVTFMLGVEGVRPIIGEVQPGSVAEQAGLRKGQEIIAVGDEPTPSWGNFAERSFRYLIDDRPLPLRVRNPDGSQREVQLPIGAGALDEFTQGKLFRRLGFSEYTPSYTPLINRVLPGGAAERAGLKAGDELLAVDGRQVQHGNEFIDYIENHPRQRVMLELRRGGETITVGIVPDGEESEDGTVGRIRAELTVPEQVREEARSLLAVERYGPVTAFSKSIGKTVETSVLTLRLMGKMILREASMENISGPISIAKYAGQSAELGPSAFCTFLAIVSVSLFVLNMLPIPLLDGGHLMYYLIEFLTRRPVSEAVQTVGQQVGFVLLLTLIGLAFYNDLTRIL